MEVARRAGWRYALLLLALVAAGCADSLPRIDSHTDIARHSESAVAEGRYDVATRTGVRIFLPDGTAAGTIRLPQHPVAVTFGGRDNDVLYIVGESSVWSIQTRVHGFRHPSG